MSEEEYKEEKPKNIVPHPWRRNFARGLDMAIYRLGLASFFMLVARWNLTNGVGSDLLILILCSLMMLFVEPLLLAYLGTTPGKWIFGLVLRDKNGQYLSYGEGFNRTLLVLFKGYGFHIPLYGLYRSIKSFGQCSDNVEMEWDEGLSYAIKDTSGMRILGLLAGWIAVFSVSYLVGIQSELPINRGRISVEEYYENCNDIMDFNGLRPNYRLSEDGSWVSQHDPNTFYFDNTKPPVQELYYDGDEIRKVVIEVDIENSSEWQNHLPYVLMAYTSFVGADYSINGFNLYTGFEDYLHDIYRDFELVKGDYKISNNVEIVGYTKTGMYLIADDEVNSSFYMKFTIEKIR